MKRFLIVLFLCSVCRGYVVDKPIMGVALDDSHDLSRGLIGVWLFNDRPGVVGRTYDLSGNQLHGTLVADTHSAPGLFGNALDFDGTGDYVAVPHNNVLNVNQNTIVAWINTTDGTSNDIVTKGNDSFVFSVGPAGQTANKLAYFLFGAAGDWVVGASDVQDGTWHQVAATFDGSVMRVYVDGVEDGVRVDAGTVGTGTTEVRIGFRTASYFTGQIDHAILYDRALSAQEVSNLYADSFQMFEQEELVVNSVAAAPAGGQVISVIMSSIPPALGVGLAIGGLALAFGWSGKRAA